MVYMLQVVLEEARTYSQELLFNQQLSDDLKAPIPFHLPVPPQKKKKIFNMHCNSCTKVALLLQVVQHLTRWQTTCKSVITSLKKKKKGEVSRHICRVAIWS